MELSIQKEIQMNKKKPANLMVSQQSSLVHNVLNQLKLIFRLMGDKRVNIFAKLIPIGAIAYLFSPDLLMFPIIGAVDDAALLWLGTYVFTELCPPEVVAEHMKALTSNLDIDAQDEVVDAEATDISDKPA